MLYIYMCVCVCMCEDMLGGIKFEQSNKKTQSSIHDGNKNQKTKKKKKKKHEKGKVTR